MNNIKLNIRALAAMKNMTIKELAEACGIEYNHLRLVSCGDATMTGDDLMALSEYTGILPGNIETSRDEYRK